jgi:hypothetical protein
MEMMRITKNVEEELKDEDNDGKRRGVRKGIVGHSDWAVLLKSRSGSNQNQTRPFKPGGSNPNHKTGSSGNSTTTLIDSGAGHNFISPKVINALGISITSVAAKCIKLGDGCRLCTKGVCKGVKVVLGEIEVVVDALVLVSVE